MMYHVRRNPYRKSPPPGWQPMASAPRDGSLIEVANNCGIASSYNLYRWCEDRKRFIQQPESPNSYGSFDENDSGFSWRATSQNVATYIDPTGGAQNTNDYWIRAAGLNPRQYPNHGRMFDGSPQPPHLRERANADPIPVEWFALAVLAIGFALILGFIVPMAVFR